MAKFTISIRRHNRESQDPPHWQDFEVDLAPENCVLDAILEARDRHDGSIGISCSCQGAICGSCGMQINGETMLACNTLLRDAAASHKTRNGTITLEPMGNMPVIKDLIVDMEAVHWKKIQQVKPWLMPAGDPPEREYIVPPESMLDITQTMACIQCGCCVAECLSLEVDPLFIGPAALAKAYRFVGDPRDAHTEERLRDLSEDPHGIYDCTHCFNCVEACPKDVAPMDQIMRLRRRAIHDFDITDRNNGRRHEEGFVNVVKKKGLLDERKLLVDSFGMFRLKGQLELLRSLPAGLRGFLRGKITAKGALVGEKLESESLEGLQRIYDHAEEHQEELRLYVLGEGGEEEE